MDGVTVAWSHTGSGAWVVPVHCEYETGNDIAIGPGANAGYSCILAGKGLRAAAGGERKCEGWAGEYTKVATVRPASELAAHKPRCCACRLRRGQPLLLVVGSSRTATGLAAPPPPGRVFDGAVAAEVTLRGMLAVLLEVGASRPRPTGRHVVAETPPLFTQYINLQL